MIYTEWLTIHGDWNNKRVRNWGLFWTWEDYYRETFSPEITVLLLIDFTTHGKTYAERKEDVRSKAIDWSHAGPTGISWGELVEIGGWFERMGRRYGLLREFREEGIA